MSKQAWTTEDELAYLNEIGTCSPSCKNMSKGQMLQGYMNGFYRRKDWTHIDKAVIKKRLVTLAYKMRKR